MAAFVSPAIGAMNFGVEAVTKLLSNTYRVFCVIEIYNWTNDILTHPVVKVAGGKVEIPPTVILPGEKAIMVARKRSFTATGSYGTVSWLIEGKHRRIVVMWTTPFNFDFYNNWLAVGITRNGVKEHAPGDTWYKEMYEGKESSSLRFNRMKYQKDIEAVIHEEDGITILGTMSTGHQAQVKIIVRPVNTSHFGADIKAHFAEPLETEP